MSGSSSDKEISNGDRDGYQGGGSDADGDNDEEEEEDAIGKKKKQQRRRRMGCDFGKRVVLHPFITAKNKIRRIRSKKALLSSSSSTASSSSSSRNVNVIIHDDGTATRTPTSDCKFCFLRPNVLETPNVSPTSDPNHPTFTHSMLKTLIENNDFYSKECNPHID